MLVLIAALLLLMALLNWMQGRVRHTWMELAAASLLLVPYWYARDGLTQRATTWLAVILLVALLPLMLGGRGLYGAAPLAYAGVLVLVGLHGSTRLLLGTLVTIFASLGLVFVLQAQPDRPTGGDGPAWTLLAITCLLIAVVAVQVWLAARDRRTVIRHLQERTQSLLLTKTAMEALAFRDTLTQLPNRTWAEQGLHHALQYVGEQRQAAVVLFDLDNFRVINESFGYPSGDALLRQIALRLQTQQPALGGLARFSSDEFIIVLDQVNDTSQVTAVAALVRRLMEQAFVVDGMDITLTVSVGMAIAPGDGTDVGTLVKGAELALRRAKERGRDCAQWFEPGLRSHVGEHLWLASSLRTALIQGQLRLHYQPKMCMRTGQVTGAEALLRWRHPERGWMEPTEFIAVAESTGLIGALGAWVLQRACEDLDTWRQAGLARVDVAVNVSPVQFRRGRLEQQVQEALARHALPADALELELTEAVFAGDTQGVQETLTRLAGLGVKLAIDDFGTGYSNLGYLQHYPVHALKIDQSFVRGMGGSRQDDAIVRAAIAMAHSLDLQVIAEGVQDEPTHERLRGYGCDQGQGFYWASALPLPEFITWVRERARAVPLQAPADLRAVSSAR